MDASQIAHSFNGKIWDHKFQDELANSVANSEPFKWGTITELMDDTLLRNVRQEVLTQIAFTKKETDIYKVYQSGDLANLSGLDWQDLSKLPSLYQLRSAIYSQEFRDFVSQVTGCGQLSGVKTDMSINTYRKGCHLLTHDDVIGSRRVSFILYLPDPDKTWEAKYGGSLRLFPSIVPNVPHPDFLVKLTPQFNQLAFFTVQPGLSFHDVEEVRYDKHRLSIQGWFHIPQSGEPGYIPGEQEESEQMSTLQLLQSKQLEMYDFPKPKRSEIKEPVFNENLAEGELKTLSQFINMNYLDPTFLKQMQATFLSDSIIELNDFLNPEYSSALHKSLRDYELNTAIPKNSRDLPRAWKCAIPPHKQRYMYIDGTDKFDLDKESLEEVNRKEIQPSFNASGENNSDELLLQLASLFSSPAYRKWLNLITSLFITSEQTLIRRFRPGHDFILATAPPDTYTDKPHELDALLEATLNLTPTATDPKNWSLGEYGGYEVCMTINEDEDDPAVYKANDPLDDSVLYTSQCKWNSLTLMLRDPLVMKFIKYVSINAKGSRWDITSQWNVDGEDEDEEDEDEDEEME